MFTRGPSEYLLKFPVFNNTFSKLVLILFYLALLNLTVLYYFITCDIT